MTSKDKEEATHPRLLMLSKFEGEIQGELKYQKSIFQYRENTDEVNSEEIPFKREEHGPTDRGFSSVLQSYEDLELLEQDQSGNRRDFFLYEKGERVAKGIQRGLSKLDSSFDGRLQGIQQIAGENKDRSGREIVEDEEIQEAKDESYQSNL